MSEARKKVKRPIFSAEWRARLSAAGRGRTLSPENKAALQEARRLCWTGRKHLPESKAKMSAAHKAAAPETRMKIAAALRGRKHSPETRAKMSAAQLGNTHNLGRTFSPEHRAKIAAASRGKVIPQEVRDKISATKKARRLQIMESRA